VVVNPDAQPSKTNEINVAQAKPVALEERIQCNRLGIQRDASERPVGTTANSLPEYPNTRST